MNSQNVTFSQPFVYTTRKTAKTREYLSCFSIFEILATLAEDELKMRKRNPLVSDLAIALPRAKGRSLAAEKGKILSSLFFPSSAGLVDSRIRYNKLLANLSAVFRENEFDSFLKRTLYRQARGHQFAHVWESLRNDPDRPVSDSVAYPTPAGSLQEEAIESPFIVDSDQLNWFNKNIGPKGISRAMNSLNPSVKHLQIGNNFICRPGAEAIRSYLIEKMSHIATWYLGGNELDSKSLSLICEGLYDDEFCKSLWLKRNPLTAAAAVPLCRLLHENTTIELLDLQNTAFGDAGVETLMSCLSETTGLKTLYLDANALGVRSAFAIASYFNALVDSAKSGLTRLWLSMNRFEDPGVEIILHSLKDYIDLEGLSIGSNGCSATTAQTAYICLMDHPKLVFLDLGMYKATADLGELTNRIGDEGIGWIAKLVAENKSLQVLSISCNGITNEGLEQLLASGIRFSSSLIHVEYHQYGMKIRKAIRDAIDSHLEKNWLSLADKQKIPLSQKQSFIRTVKHTKHVHFIRSINT